MSEAIAIQAPFSPSEGLAAAHLRLLQGRVHKHGPSANTRASSIGNECERSIFYDQTVPAEDRATHTPQLQAIFDMGRIAEQHGLRVLEDMGAEIVQRERDHVDREHKISGHIDVKLRMPGWPKAIPCELKSTNPFTGEKIKTLEDIRDSRIPYVRRYYDQLQTYLYLEGEDLGCFIFWNKSTWWPTFIDCPRDEERIQHLVAKAERVRLAVLNNEPPPRTQSQDCTRCQFFTICSPDVSFGPGVTLLDNPELEALVARRAELEAAHREYEAVDKELKGALPEAEEVVLGDYVITGKQIFRRGYAVKAGSYWKREIRRIGGSK